MAEIQLNKVYQYNDIILLLRYLFDLNDPKQNFWKKMKWSFKVFHQEYRYQHVKENQWIRHLHLTRKQIRGVLT